MRLVSGRISSLDRVSFESRFLLGYLPICIVSLLRFFLSFFRYIPFESYFFSHIIYQGFFCVAFCYVLFARCVVFIN